jgi:hypothetical protein
MDGKQKELTKWALLLSPSIVISFIADRHLLLMQINESNGTVPWKAFGSFESNQCFIAERFETTTDEQVFF